MKPGFLQPELPAPADGQKFIEVIEPHEMQTLLRKFEGLQSTVCQRISEIEPWRLRVYGAVLIYGEMKAYSTEVDLRGIQNSDDIVKFAGVLLKAIEQAADAISKGTYVESEEKAK